MVLSSFMLGNDVNNGGTQSLPSGLILKEKLNYSQQISTQDGTQF